LLFTLYAKPVVYLYDFFLLSEASFVDPNVIQAAVCAPVQPTCATVFIFKLHTPIYSIAQVIIDARCPIDAPRGYLSS
jgi:hypothetical protein